MGNYIQYDQSLYKQHCCKVANLGKSIKIVTKTIDHVFFCPFTLPTYCPVQTFESCSDVASQRPNATSGYYSIRLMNGSTTSVYCNIQATNCDGEGGWMRVAYLNMSEKGSTCPVGLFTQSYSELDHDVCGRDASILNAPVPGCATTGFSTYGMN